MRFTLSAVALECRDADRTQQGYVGFGCTRVHDGVLGAGVDAMLEFGTAATIPPTGKSIDRIVFTVDNLSAAVERLSANGVELVSTSQDGSAVVLGPDGLRIEIRQANGRQLPPIGPGMLRFHHVCLLTSDYEASEEFFVSNFGMKKVYDFSKSGVAGFMFLADSQWDAGDHGFLLEIIGGPEFMTEQQAWDAHGAHYDHVCFSMSDVPAAYDRGLEAGLAPMSRPKHYPEYGLDIAWLYDRDGLHVELLEEMPTDEMQASFETGVVENNWDDGANASLDMIPFVVAG